MRSHFLSKEGEDSLIHFLAVSGEGTYLLTFATSKGEDLAQIINFPGNEGLTPLYYASQSNRVEMTEYLS